MTTKQVIKNISEQKENKIFQDIKSSSNSFAVAFGDRTEFDFLSIKIYWESTQRSETYKIASEFLPFNKSNTTRFRLIQDGDYLRVKWCSKVANNMIEI